MEDKNIDKKMIKYKNNIKTILIGYDYDIIEKNREALEHLLDSEFKRNMLNEEEYDELNEYIQQIVTELINESKNKEKLKKITDDNKKRERYNDIANNDKKNFYEENKINFTPIYKGDWNKIASRRNEKDGEER